MTRNDSRAPEDLNLSWELFQNACLEKEIFNSPDMDTGFRLHERLSDYIYNQRHRPEGPEKLDEAAIARIVGELTDPPGLKERLTTLFSRAVEDIRQNPERYDW